MRNVLVIAIAFLFFAGPIVSVSEAAQRGKRFLSQRRIHKTVSQRNVSYAPKSKARTSSSWYRQRVNPRTERQAWFSDYSY